MNLKAYVLIDCKPRTSKSIVQNLFKIDGVVEADALWGRYEIIAVVKVRDLDELEHVVCDQIKAINGITNTMTSICKKKNI